MNKFLKKNSYLIYIFGIVIIFFLLMWITMDEFHLSNVNIEPQGTDQCDNTYVLEQTEENIMNLTDKQIDISKKLLSKYDVVVKNVNKYSDMKRDGTNSDITIFEGYDDNKIRRNEMIGKIKSSKLNESETIYDFHILGEKDPDDVKAEYSNFINVSYKGKSNQFTFENGEFLKEYLQNLIGEDLNLKRIEDIINELAKYDDGIANYNICYGQYRITIMDLRKSITKDSTAISFKIRVELEWVK